MRDSNSHSFALEANALANCAKGPNVIISPTILPYVTISTLNNSESENF